MRCPERSTNAQAPQRSSVHQTVCRRVDLLAQQYPEGDYPELPAESGPAETAEVRLYYDDSFAACGQETAAYVLDIHMEQAERMIEATLEMREGSGGREAESSIYRLEVGHHIARRTDDSEG